MYEGVCPDCGKPAKKMKSKSGKIFYGCSGYPLCKFMSWDKPTGKKCPLCGGAIVATARGKVRCANRDCNYKEEDITEEKTDEE